MSAGVSSLTAYGVCMRFGNMVKCYMTGLSPNDGFRLIVSS